MFYIKLRVQIGKEWDAWNRDIWVDLLQNLELPESPETSDLLKVVHPPPIMGHWIWDGDLWIGSLQNLELQKWFILPD
jgi:hypothetical protein